MPTILGCCLFAIGFCIGLIVESLINDFMK